MIDAHAHLLDERFSGEEIVKSMQQDKLDYIVTIGTNVKTSQDSAAFANNHEKVFATVGIHPEYVNTTTKKDIEQIAQLAKENKVVAIGEIGLDYHYGADQAEKQKQKELFISQIKIANKNNLPIVIHCRDAADDVLEVLRANKQYLGAGVVMHCYSEGAAYVPKFNELGCYFSFTGNITFKNADRSFLKDIPLGKIMVETDCPWLAPEPVRGTTNYPKNVWYVAQKIADTLELSIEKFEKIVVENTKRFYKKMD